MEHYRYNIRSEHSLWNFDGDLFYLERVHLIMYKYLKLIYDIDN